MKFKIELTEYDAVGETGKVLKLQEGNCRTDVHLELIDKNVIIGTIVCDLRHLRRALDKIAL